MANHRLSPQYKNRIAAESAEQDEFYSEMLPGGIQDECIWCGTLGHKDNDCPNRSAVQPQVLVDARKSFENSREALARERKAQAMALVMFQNGISSEQAQDMSQKQWEMVAKAARQHPPGSMATKALTVEKLRAMEKARGAQ